ncbi:unnamed protein product [Parajaminaea phylloscopi]
MIRTAASSAALAWRRSAVSSATTSWSAYSSSASASTMPSSLVRCTPSSALTSTAMSLRMPAKSAFSTFSAARQNSNGAGSSSDPLGSSSSSASPSSSTSSSPSQPSQQSRTESAAPPADTQAWGELMSVLNSSTGSAATDFASHASTYGDSSHSGPLRPVEDLQDEAWADRTVIGPPPVTPYTGRTVNVRRGNVAASYNALSGLLNRNQVNRDWRKAMRYEKPNDERKRKASQRHRRRFANMIRQKVKMVMELKNRSG